MQRRDGATETIRSSAPPLGLAEKSKFEETKVDLHQGDAFLLYTDGLAGAEDGGTHRLAIERVVEMLPKNPGSAQALLAGTLEKTMPDNSGKPLADDLAALAVRRAE